MEKTSLFISDGNKSEVTLLNNDQLRDFTRRLPGFYGPQKNNEITSEVNSILQERLAVRLRNSFMNRPVPNDEDFMNKFLEEFQKRHVRALPPGGYPLGINIPGTVIGQVSQSTLNSGKQSGTIRGTVQPIELVKDIMLARNNPKGGKIVIGLIDPWYFKGSIEMLTKRAENGIVHLTLKDCVDSFEYYSPSEFRAAGKIEWWHDFYSQRAEKKNFNSKSYAGCCRIIFNRNKVYSHEIILGRLVSSGIAAYPCCVVIPSPTDLMIIDVFLEENYVADMPQNAVKAKRIIASRKPKKGASAAKVTGGEDVLAQAVLKILVENTAPKITIDGVRGVETVRLTRKKSKDLIQGYDTVEVGNAEIYEVNPKEMTPRELSKIYPPIVNRRRIAKRIRFETSSTGKGSTGKVSTGKGLSYRHKLWLNREVMESCIIGAKALEEYVHIICDNPDKGYECQSFRFRDQVMARYLTFSIPSGSSPRHPNKKLRSLGKISPSERLIDNAYRIRIHSKYLDSEGVSIRSIRQELEKKNPGYKYHGYESRTLRPYIQFITNNRNTRQLYEDWPDVFHYQVVGGSLADIFCLKNVDPLVSYSYNTHEISDLMGIGACVNITVKNLYDIFTSIGTVDKLELQLIVSEMTSSGIIRGLKTQRAGRGDFVTQAGYQQIPVVMSNATIFNSKEKTKGSITVPVTIGSIPPVGTGYVSVNIKAKPIDERPKHIGVSDGKWFVPERDAGSVLDVNLAKDIYDELQRSKITIHDIVRKNIDIPDSFTSMLGVTLDKSSPVTSFDIRNMFIIQPTPIPLDAQINIDLIVAEFLKVKFRTSVLATPPFRR